MDNITKIDGEIYANMLAAGAAVLKENEKTVNELNVFPVPDGDTGDNMLRTMTGGVGALTKTPQKDLSKATAVAARGMLLGARGNSGVILSQFFDGVKKATADKQSVTVDELKDVMVAGTLRAYAAVGSPTEGTILTVMKDAGSKAKAEPVKTAAEYFDCYLTEVKQSLQRTPDLLPVLKEAGVVDSGGAGFMYIIKGMLDALTGKAAAYEKGEYEDLDVELHISNKDRKKYACVAVGDGDGLIEQFKTLGVDYVVDGKQTMNPSTKDFIDAFNAVNSDNIFVFPNNSNIIMAAKQAAELYDKSNIIVLPSKTLAEGYAALSMMDYSCDDAGEIASEFEMIIESVSTGLITYSIRDCKIQGKSIKKGDYIGMIGKDLLSCNKDLVECVNEFLDAMDKTDKTVVVAIKGKDCPDVADKIAAHLAKVAPDMEFYDVYGGQDVYTFILAVE